jgi:hypothetical protein
MDLNDHELSEAIRDFEDGYDKAFTKEILDKIPELTILQIVKKIISVIAPDFEISYLPWEDSIRNIPPIESMDTLYFKQSNNRILYSENKYREYVDKIKLLNLSVESVGIVKFNYIGKFIEVKLLDHNQKKTCEKLDEQKDIELKQREIELKQREIALEQRKTSLKQKETALEQRETSLKQRQTALEQRQTALEQIDKRLEQIEKRLDLIVNDICLFVFVLVCLCLY